MRTIAMVLGGMVLGGMALAAALAGAPALAQTPADEAAVRAIVANLEADRPDPHVSPKLDWENAFGIRYHDLKKRDAFYSAVVAPQFKTATSETLETQVQFVGPAVAVADTWWHVAGQIYAGETKPGPDRWGRTTYVLRKQDGAWTEVIERVADLRLPYYKHLAALPAAAPLAPAVLQSYAGRYRSAGAAKAPQTVDVAVDGDHLTLKTERGTLIAVPTSASDFLVFYSADDVAEYFKARFSLENGVAGYTLTEAWGEPLGRLERER